jgi:hypothetical protein
MVRRIIGGRSGDCKRVASLPCDHAEILHKGINVIGEGKVESLDIAESFLLKLTNGNVVPKRPRLGMVSYHSDELRRKQS